MAADVWPPMYQEGAWSYDDLELDVVDNPGRFLEVVDEDEFEHARLSVPYPLISRRAH
ncbi:DUF402 domain-containing protein [Actinopolymorpha pittospori]|uniref:DUF402 domain-containing protein n=1 Tax=Actinopolymorpha pittospori TaxID=648752 RepID=UPI003B5888A7